MYKVKCEFKTFYSDEHNLVAKLNLQLERPNVDKARSLAEDTSKTDEKVHKVLQDSVGSGKVGNLKVDPQFLIFEPQSCK